MVTKIFDEVMRTEMSRYIYCIILFNIFYFLIPSLSSLKLLVFLIPTMSLLFAFSFKRTSENFILNKATGTLNMNLMYPKSYRKYHYINQKEDIANKLKEEFIKGIFIAAENKKKLKMQTHKWMIENVIEDERIKSQFIITVIEKENPVFIMSEILVLVNRSIIRECPIEIYEIAKRPRKGFTVKLSKKTIKLIGGMK